MKFALPILSVCLFLSGCGSMMENIVPAGHPKYEDIGKIVRSIKKGTPKWAVKMKLGNPAVRSPNEWHYMVYGKDMAAAHIYFDENGRVKSVYAPTGNEQEPQVRIRRSGRR